MLEIRVLMEEPALTEWTRTAALVWLDSTAPTVEQVSFTNEVYVVDKAICGVLVFYNLVCSKRLTRPQVSVRFQRFQSGESTKQIISTC